MTRKVQSGFRPNSFGKFGLVHPNWAPIRVLDVNPNLSLHGKSSRPYIRGCRPIETTHNRKNTSTNSISQTLVILLLRSSAFFVLESSDLRSPRGERIDLGKPITAVRPDGVSPGRVGFWVFKSARRIVLRIALPVSLLWRRVLRIALNAEGTREVFVCQHIFWRLCWGRSS